MPSLDTVTSFILADGFGPGPAPGASTPPRVLTELLGRPLIFHQLDTLARAGLKRVALCAGHGLDLLASAVGTAYRGLDIQYVRVDGSQGTGAALSLALERQPGELALILDGETLSDAALPDFLAWFAARDADAALLLAQADAAGPMCRVETDAAGLVTGFTGQGGAGRGWRSAGVLLLRPQSLAASALRAPLEGDLLTALAASGRLCARHAPGRALDLGRPEAFAQAGRFLLGPGGSAAVFLDRDGTVIEERNYLSDPDGVVLLPGAAEGLRRMRALGLRMVLVSNQSGVGRGYFGRDAVERVHGRLLELLEAQGAGLDALYVCPHAPSEFCRCRKPLPGLIDRAVRELGFDPAISFVIGDKPCDVDLGLTMNATTFLVTTGHGARHVVECAGRAQHVVRGLDEAAGIMEALCGAGGNAGR